MTDITQLGFPTGFLGLDENQSSTNPVGNISIGDYVSAHRKLENTPSGERSKTSSATGPGGLIDSTQQYLQNKYKLPSGYGTNADINDQYDNALITDQQETLKKSNLEPTALNHRLTSWFGSAGGPKVIASNDTESINNILSPDAIKANGLDPKMTVGALKSKVERNLLDQGVNPKFTVGNTNQTASDSPFSVVQDTNKYTPYQAVPSDVGTTPATPTEKTPTQSQLPAYKMALNNINVTKRDIAPASNATTPNYQKEINAVASPQIGKNFAKGLASVGDVALGALPAAVGSVNYFVNRLAGDTPQQAEQYSQKLVEPIQNPIGRAFGITEDPAYKNEASRRLLGSIGTGIQKGSQTYSEVTGANPTDVEQSLNAAMFLVPELANKVSAPVRTVMEKQFAKRQGKPTEEVIPKENVSATEQSNVVNAVNREIPNTIENPPEDKFVVSEADKAAKIKANKEKLDKIEGLELHRLSALEENPKEASSQYMTAKADQGIYGTSMSGLINHEKEALTNHFGDVESTIGGIPGESVRQRINGGKVIKTDLNEAKTDYDTETQRLYNAAKEEHGDKVVHLNTLEETLNNGLLFPKTETQSFRNTLIKDYKNKGLMNEDGTLNPMTVAQSEKIRQDINSIIGQSSNYDLVPAGMELKKAIDKDVFSDVRSQTYEPARQHFGQGKDMFENPATMKKLLQDEEAVDQKLADEKTGAHINKLQQSQFDDLWHTLEVTGKTGAKKQIQTNLINEVKSEGAKNTLNEPWNQIAAKKRFDELEEKFNTAFANEPEVLNKIKDGLEAGHVLHIPRQYPGAATQAHKLKIKFLETGITGATGAAGAGLSYMLNPIPELNTLAGLGGAWVGKETGASLARTVQNVKQKAAFKKETESSTKKNVRPIKDLTNFKANTKGKE